MSYTGRCACGKVTLRIEGEPIATRQCWCRQCQQATGGGPTHNAMFATDDVTIDGELASHEYGAASGNTITQFFCPSCGSPIGGMSSARPHFRAIRFGALDEPHGLKPQVAIWTDDAPEWAVIDPSLEQVSRQPTAPPKPD
ncbi:MAG: GFA family protein [Novosphingobium sp.]